MNLLLIVISMASLPLLAMEQNQPDTFPYEQLLPELKGLVIQAVADAANVSEAIAIFKNLLLTSKQFNTQQASNLFLIALINKFPGQEVRIAKLLNNQFAKEWLNARRKAQSLPPYIPVKTSEKDRILVPLLSGDLVQTKKWLEKGSDPSIILHTAIKMGPPGNSLPLIELLVAYGADINQVLLEEKTSLLYDVLQLKNAYSSSGDVYTKHYAEIAYYLIQEGAALKPGEEEELIKLQKEIK